MLKLYIVQNDMSINGYDKRLVPIRIEFVNHVCDKHHCDFLIDDQTGTNRCAKSGLVSKRRDSLDYSSNEERYETHIIEDKIIELRDRAGTPEHIKNGCKGPKLDFDEIKAPRPTPKKKTKKK